VNVDDLELELRKLPGVRSAGFTDRDDVLLIQLQVSGDSPPANLSLQATRIAYRHSEKPVALEVVRWRVSPRPRDLAPPGVSPLEGALGSIAGVEPRPEEPERLLDDAEDESDGLADIAVLTVAPPVVATVEPADVPLREPRDQRVRLLAVLTFP